jgi:hypothetical protein
MFDTQTLTTSSANTELSVTIASGVIDTVAVLNCTAETVTITVRDGLGGVVLFNETTTLIGGSLPENAWDYYFTDPTVLLTQAIAVDIPTYQSAHVTITLLGGSAVSAGNVVMGRGKSLGLAEYGASSGILDFSTKTTSSFGETTFVKKGFKKTLNVRSFVENTYLNIIQNTLYSVRATPCLWIANEDTIFSEALVLYGFYKDFNTEITYPAHSYITIEIEGLI